MSYYVTYVVKGSTKEEFKQDEILNAKAGPKPASNPSPTITKADIQKFEQLSLGPKWLYVDGLNYGSKFFGRGGNHWSILDGVEKIKRFIKAAKNSGWQLKVFIDAAAKSNEAMGKWRKRREAEVSKESREVPQAMNVLIGDAFQENGIEVLYSVDADNDDTLAAYASRDGAAILSGDRDFFRYRGLTCQIYGEFKIEKGHLVLIELIQNDKYVSKRNLILPPPKVMDKDPSLVDLSSHIYRRGAPSSLVKRMGNVHVTCRSLRQALYSRKGVTNPVLEIFPIWQNDRADWLEEHVLPDNKLDHLLDNPVEAVEFFFPKATLVKPEEVPIKEWNNHLYGIYAVIYELCALGNKNGISFLELIRPAILQVRGEKKQKDSKPAYETVCVGCKILIVLYEKDVVFYQSQGFSMPKRCKGCKQAKQAKQEKLERRNQRQYANYYY